MDTGAELPTIPAALYQAKLKEVELEPSSVIVRLYDGTTLPTIGEMVVEVLHGQQLVKGQFIIVEKVYNQLPGTGYTSSASTGPRCSTGGMLVTPKYTHYTQPHR